MKINLIKILAVYLFIILFSFYSKGQPGFLWAKSMGGSVGNDYGKSMCVDATGNIYTIGTFEGVADFDPGPATFTLNAVGLSDIFISKIDASGNFKWAKRIGGVDNDYGTSIAKDNNGNVYATGYFSQTVDFDPGNSVFNLTSNGLEDIFITKLDSLGNFVWAKNFGGAVDDKATAIVIDANMGVYTTGVFEKTADFDPGPGTFTLSTLMNEDIFISKLDAFGNFIWAKSFGGSQPDYGTFITTDLAGNVYTTGYFQGIADFDPSPVSYTISSVAGWHDIFISKLDGNGNFIWARSMGGMGIDIGNSLCVDGVGNVYSTGYFRNTADFDPGTSGYSLTAMGMDEVYVSKLDINGDFLWAKSFGSTLVDVSNSIVLDASGNLFTVGWFNNTVDFDPGSGVYNLTSAGAADIFISKLDINGNFICAGSIGGTGTDIANCIVAAGGNIYISGNFMSVVDFDPGPGTYTCSSQGYRDVFMSKLSPSCISVNIKDEDLTSNYIRLYPNPATNILNIATQTEFLNSEIEIKNTLGQTVIKSFFKQEIDVSSLASGFYTFQLTSSNNQTFVNKFIKE